MINEARLLLEEAIDCMDLNEEQKQKFLPIWNTHRNMLAKMIAQFGENQFERGKDQHIEINNLD